MKTKLTSIAFGIGTTLLFAGNSTAQQVGLLDDFSGMSISGVNSIILSQGDSCSIKTDDDKSLSKVTVVVKDGVLDISGAPVDGNIYVTVKSINRIKVQDAANVRNNSELITDSITIISTGAGKTSLKLKAKKIFIDITGAGKVKLSGTTDLLDVQVPGAGTVNGYDMETQRAHIRVPGAGNVKINVAKELDAHISGAGNIIYRGAPSERNVEITGIGSVKQSEKGNEEDNEEERYSDMDGDSVRKTPDTTKIKLENMKILIIKYKNDSLAKKKDKSIKKSGSKSRHWAGLELGINGFASYSRSLNLPSNANFMELDYSKSIHFGFNFLEKGIRVYKEYAKVVTGLGIDFNTYGLRNNVSLLSNNDSVWGVTETTYKLDKNKLKTTFINVPLLLAFNTSNNRNKAFHFAAGVIVGYDVWTRTKQEFNIGSEKHNRRISESYNINPFRYSATARVGYGNFNVYASYALNSLFKTGTGPELYPFTVGIRILML